MAGFDPSSTHESTQSSRSSGFEDSEDCLADSDVFPLTQYSINFNVHNIIGQGAFGIVFKGRHKQSGRQVAAKMIKATHGKEINDFLNEVKNITRIKPHPNVVQLLDYAYFQENFYMIMEYCDRGDLVRYFKENNPDLATKVKFFVMAANALEHMHGQQPPVVHRDIKPANIMIKSVDGVPTVKMADFGLAKIVDLEAHQTTVIMESQRGTPGFMAPEFFAREKYTKSVDVFALGLVLLAMMKYNHRKPSLIPLIENHTRIKAIGEEMYEAKFASQPQPILITSKDDDTKLVKEIIKIIHDMTCYDPRQRLKAYEVVLRVQQWTDQGQDGGENRVDKGSASPAVQDSSLVQTDSKCLLVKDFSPDTREEELILLVADAAELSEDDMQDLSIHMSHIADAQTALVTYSIGFNAEEADRIISEIESEPFKGATLKVENVCSPTHILMDNLSEGMHMDVLRRVIGRKIGRGEVDKIDMIEGKNAAVVTMTSSTVAEKLLNADIGFLGRSFECYPFYPEYGVAIHSNEVQKERIAFLLNKPVGDGLTTSLTDASMELSEVETTKTNEDTSGDKVILFHQVHGKNIQLSNDRNTALRINNFDNGICFTHRPIKVNEEICVKITKVGQYVGTICVGFTTHDPGKLLASDLPTRVCPFLTKEPGNWAGPLPECLSKVDSVFSFCVTSEGKCMYWKKGNAKKAKLFLKGVDTDKPLWAIIDVFGELVLELLPQSITPENVADNLKAMDLRGKDKDNDKNETVEEESCLPIKVFHHVLFHEVSGENIQLSEDQLRAERSDGYNKGVCFSHRPISVEEHMHLKITEASTEWSGGLSVGFTSQNPAEFHQRPDELPDDTLKEQPSWCVKMLPEQCSVHDTVHFYVTDSGNLMYGVNQRDMQLHYSGVNIDQPLWAVVDVYGNTLAVEWVGGPPKEKPSILCAPVIPQGQKGAEAPEPRQLCIDSANHQFHTVHGKNIKLSEDRQLAERTKSFCDGICFSSSSLELYERVWFQIVYTDESIQWSGGICVGFTSNDPLTLHESELPRFADLTSLPRFWARGLQSDCLAEGTCLFFYVTGQGEVIYGVNGKEKGVLFEGVATTSPLWAIVDVCGQTTAVKLIKAVEK